MANRIIPFLAVFLLFLSTGAAQEPPEVEKEPVLAEKSKVAEFFRGRVEDPPKSPVGRYPRARRNKMYDQAVKLGLDWLRKHQASDGHWDSDGFVAQCKLNQCDRPGGFRHDVGVTALAVLAFLGAGHGPFHGEHKETVVNGLTWILAAQTPDGCFGTDQQGEYKQYLYGHAIATLAVAEGYGMSQSPFLKRAAERAIAHIEACRNPYLAWRYGPRPGDNDTSVTVWMICALKSAKAAGLTVPSEAFEGARAWLEKATEPEYGRVGYTSRGTPPARPQADIDRFPADKSESLTAGGMLARMFIGEDPRRSEMIGKGGELLLKALPVWDETSGSIDMYYWYFGSLAMFQVGGKPWETWNEAMKHAVLDSQRKDGDQRGSWDPLGAWGKEGGRVYSTALMTMIAETPRRYPRIYTGRMEYWPKKTR